MAISDFDLADLNISDVEQQYQLFKLSIQDLYSHLSLAARVSFQTLKGCKFISICQRLSYIIMLGAFLSLSVIFSLLFSQIFSLIEFCAKYCNLFL